LYALLVVFVENIGVIVIVSEPQKAAFDRDGVKIYLGDCRDILPTLQADSVHCCVTSPPYFGLRDYGCDGQIGLEPTPAEFVAEMVAVFREVRRVLRDDGVCWLNLGDSYCGYKGDQYGIAKGNLTARTPVATGGRFETGTPQTSGVKNKDLIGIPWMVAFALRADGWYLRQDIIWHKPNPMPESVTDRCTKSHEYMFLLTKSDRYFFDNQAIQESSITNDDRRPYGSQGAWDMDGRDESKRPKGKPRTAGNKSHKYVDEYESSESEEHRTKAGLMKVADVPWEKRNKRSVWTVTTKPYGGAHFAVFPPDLIEPCILAGTSESGCCSKCGTPWRRQIEKDRKATRPGNKTKVGRASDDEGSPYESHSGMIVGNRDPQRHCTTTKTIGWEAGCECEAGTQVPCVVLDPFTGSGTTAAVAKKNGCHFVGCELNPEYLKLAADRFKQRSLALG
jgi:DNA modification methylase